ncbi:GLPGLI family protein [Flavobacterium sandaracinum]|uniref:GLPGLI family protein n=1 Tax=Flavobacterium sandaracinum TaxID=2541733 RepID=A0A4V2Z1U2_9FLAO|nr:GLPGLI family protein [Flavobacterium sandaracinum]TDE05168.1 GLPGLI family protein [Flavobacterium sandaracinum]
MRLILISILLISSVMFAQSSGTVTYSFNVPFELESITNQDTKDFAKKIIDLANNQEFELSFNKSQSQFICVEKLNFASEFDQKLNNVAKSGFTSHDVFSNFEISTQITIMNDGTLVEDQINKLDWEISSESKMIGAYLCYKAVLKIPFVNRYRESKIKEVISWFAPSLPYSYGPKNFHGLPGLILELNENNKTSVASKIKLSDNVAIINFPKGKTISKAEYEKMLESSMGAVILSKKREKETDKQ